MPNLLLKCTLTQCSRYFSRLNSLKARFSAYHRSPQNRVTSAASSICTFHCAIFDCNFEADAENGFFGHLRNHLDEQLVVSSPFWGCNKDYIKHKSFKSHTFWKQKQFLPEIVWEWNTASTWIRHLCDSSLQLIRCFRWTWTFVTRWRSSQQWNRWN